MQNQNTAQETAAKDASALIATLELPYLIALQSELAKHINARKADGIAQAKEQIRKLAESVGLDLRTLLTAKPIKSSGPAPIKYRHPDVPTLQWSGRGRQPQWVKEWLDAGKPITAIEV